MTQRTILSALATVALVGLGAAYLFQRPGAHNKAENARSNAEAYSLKALEEEVAELRRQTQNTARGMQALRTETERAENAAELDRADPPSPAETEAPKDGAEPGRPGPESEEYRAWQAERQALIADTEAAFQFETRNADWARKASSDLEEAAIKYGSAKAALRTIDCRSTTCRVEVIDDPEKAEDLRNFLMDASTLFPTMVADRIENPGDHSSYVMYFKSGA